MPAGALIAVHDVTCCIGGCRHRIRRVDMVLCMGGGSRDGGSTVKKWSSSYARPRTRARSRCVGCGFLGSQSAGHADAREVERAGVCAGCADTPRSYGAGGRARGTTAKSIFKLNYYIYILCI